LSRASSSATVRVSSSRLDTSTLSWMHTQSSTTIAAENTRLTGVSTPSRSASQNASPGKAAKMHTPPPTTSQIPAYFSRTRRVRSRSSSSVTIARHRTTAKA
jgi:hypothetical protein